MISRSTPARGMMGVVSETPYITRFRVRNFGCVQDCELKLSRLHALVGPNDSGKSTLLRSIAASQAALRASSGDLLHVTGREVDLKWSDGWSVRLFSGGQPHRELAEWESSAAKSPPFTLGLRPDGAPLRGGAAQLVRLEPDEIRGPSHLIPSNRGIQLSERGAGLPAVYDALLARKRRAFDAIERRLVELFPQVESLVLSSVSESKKQLAVVLRGRDEPIAAPELSEGMLYFLAFMALAHLDPPPPVVLVEEPENGLHPARIREVVASLRELSMNTQVIMATHSPLVINELEGNEISVITRDDHGTHAMLLSDTPRYTERSSVYKNGELWLSYGDGKQEEALLQGKPAP